MMSRNLLFVAVLAALLVPCAASAEVKLPAIFGENMVLQGTKAVLWGTAAPNEAVSVKIGAKKGKTTAGADGKWTLTLQHLKSGGPYEMTVSGSNTLTIHNVAVGEVWLCAGASNMAFPLNGAGNAEAAIASAKFPMIRVFTASAGWVVCDPKTARYFPAVAYFFGRELHQKLKTPVGLISAAASSTPAEAWISSATLESKPALKALVDAWKTEAEAYPKAKEAYAQLYATWKEESRQAKAANQPAPMPPRRPKPPDDPSAPSGAYDALIAPVIPYSIRGAIWYQGEANTADPQLLPNAFSDAHRKLARRVGGGRLSVFIRPTRGFPAANRGDLGQPLGRSARGAGVGAEAAGHWNGRRDRHRR